MGRRGPRPKPTALKLIQGNPGKRAINGFEPKPSTTMPVCPNWLDGEAKDAWRRLAPKLRNMGVLTQIDGDALANYCDAWSRWKRAAEFLQKNGDVYTIKDDAGKPKCVAQWPQVSIARNMVLILNRYQQEFGLTPASRTRINIGDPFIAQASAPSVADWDKRRREYDAMIWENSEARDSKAVSSR